MKRIKLKMNTTTNTVIIHLAVFKKKKLNKIRVYIKVSLYVI